MKELKEFFWLFILACSYLSIGILSIWDSISVPLEPILARDIALVAVAIGIIKKKSWAFIGIKIFIFIQIIAAGILLHATVFPEHWEITHGNDILSDLLRTSPIIFLVLFIGLLSAQIKVALLKNTKVYFGRT